MTNTSIELYNALLEAGSSEKKAEKAARSLISRDEAYSQLATKQDLLKLKSKLIMWMVGLQIASVTLLLTILG